MIGRGADVTIIEANHSCPALTRWLSPTRIAATNPEMCGEMGVTLPPTYASSVLWKKRSTVHQ